MKAVPLTRIARHLRAGLLMLAKFVTEPFLWTRTPSVRMASLDGMRYPYFLVTAFATQGPVIIPPRELGHARRLFGLWQALTTFRISPDASAPRLSRAAERKSGAIEIYENYFDTVEETDFCAPYFAHPDFYRHNLHKALPEFRRTKKTVRLFFAGTHAPQSYREVFQFPMLSRSDILEHLRLRYNIETDKLADVITTGGRLFRFALTSSTKNSLDKHQLKLSDYVSSIAAADFFLCPPGFMVPHSHNVVEALSVGTVPICNYGDYMRPPLVDGLNCLAFRTLDDLDAVLDRILSMSEDELSLLRQGAIAYYDEHLDPSKFARTFLSEAGRIKRLVVNAAEEDMSLPSRNLPRTAADTK